MSRFSGKCDLFDEIYAIHDGDIEYFKRSEIYLGHSFEIDEEKKSVKLIPGKRIYVESEKDLVPYYAHIISSMASDEDHATIYLTEESWPDMERQKAKEHGFEYLMYDYYKEQLAEEMKKYGIEEEGNG